MLDYQAIAALSSVIELQSFKGAAKKLYITQSAISQRIKSLENYYGEPVLIRILPYRATRLGSMLLGHFRHTILLEHELKEALLAPNYKQKISIAISRDSLETWFGSITDHLKDLDTVILDIIADDQDITLSYLQNGFVSACASTSNKKLTGCKVDFLGYLDYILVASPQFIKNYFVNKNYRKNLIKAPSIIFDSKDELTTKYLKHFFSIKTSEIQYHVIPSVAGFRQFALNGYAYALIPKIDINKELRQKKLVNIFPDKIWRMPIYWHSFSIKTKLYKMFNELVLTEGKKLLAQK